VLPIAAGATVPADHGYLVHAMLKSECRPDITARGWTFQEMDGRRTGGVIELDHRKAPALTLRVPQEDLGYVMKLPRQQVRLGQHLLVLSDPLVRQVAPHHRLRSEFVYVTSDKHSIGVRYEDFGVHVGKRLAHMLGRVDFGVLVGKVRTRHIAGVKHYGYPVDVISLTDEESLMLQWHGIGEGRGMGFGSIWRTECP